MAQQSVKVQAARLVARVGTRGLHHTPPALNVKAETLSPLYTFGGVHGSRSGQKTWRNKPLFRREVLHLLMLEKRTADTRMFFTATPYGAISIVLSVYLSYPAIKL